MKTLTLLWTFLLAMQSNRSAEFPILHSPALIPKFPQSPSGSYLFSHCPKQDLRLVPRDLDFNPDVAIALRLLPVFTRSKNVERKTIHAVSGNKVAIALKLLPVFTR